LRSTGDAHTDANHSARLYVLAETSAALAALVPTSANTFFVPTPGIACALTAMSLASVILFLHDLTGKANAVRALQTAVDIVKHTRALAVAAQQLRVFAADDAAVAGGKRGLGAAGMAAADKTATMLDDTLGKFAEL
jgi:hypothetical protein